MSINWPTNFRLGKRGEPLYGWPLAVLLAATTWVLSWSATLSKSPTFDEPSHLLGGYTYWAFDDYRIQPENGNLPQRLGGIAALMAGPPFPSLDQEAWRDEDRPELVQQWLYTPPADYRPVFSRARAIMALLGAGLVLLVYGWSRSLYGMQGGLVSAVLAAFCPTILANAALVTSDLAGALFFTAALAASWRLMHATTPLNMALAIGMLSGLARSKFSFVLILPVLGGLALARIAASAAVAPAAVAGSAGSGQTRGERLRRLTATALVLAAGVYAAIWCAYGFRYQACHVGLTEPDLFASKFRALGDQFGLPGKLLKAVYESRLLPEAFVTGFGRVLRHAQHREAYLCGLYRSTGWWWFFPFSFLVKTPLPTLGILATAAVAGLRVGATGGPRPRMWYRTLPLWLMLFVYGGASVTSRLNIGQRHLLPMYPLIFILAGSLAANWGSLHRFTRAGLVGCLVLLPIEALLTWPNYLAYFNQFVGGSRNGYRCLVDSSLDWGQDLPGVRRWIERRKETSGADEAVYLSYFGSGDPVAEGIVARMIPRSTPVNPLARDTQPSLGPGVYLISSSTLVQYAGPAKGPWNDEYEARYQAFGARLQDAAPGKQPWEILREDEWDEYRALRLARLSAHLRRREPDDQINYSINVYIVDDELMERFASSNPAGAESP